MVRRTRAFEGPADAGASNAGPTPSHELTYVIIASIIGIGFRRCAVMSLYDQISSQILKRAYLYIISRQWGGRLPSRSRIDPLDMAKWLDHTELLDVINHGETFRYRIAGGEIERVFQSHMHGRRLEQVFTGEVLSFKLLMFRRCVENRVAILSNNTLEREGRSVLKYERILIPMSEDGINVDIIFGCIYPMEVPVQRFNMSDPNLAIIAEQVLEHTLV